MFYVIKNEKGEEVGRQNDKAEALKAVKSAKGPVTLWDSFGTKISTEDAPKGK